MYKAKILVKRRKSILDPQGKASEQGAKLLGYSNISKVRIDKSIEFFIATVDEVLAKTEATEFCNKLLANPIMEDFEIILEKVNES
jgi:phosphoribosylformylglycinamidine synthase subunit PurS